MSSNTSKDTYKNSAQESEHSQTADAECIGTIRNLFARRQSSIVITMLKYVVVQDSPLSRVKPWNTIIYSSPLFVIINSSSAFVIIRHEVLESEGNQFVPTQRLEQIDNKRHKCLGAFGLLATNLVPKHSLCSLRSPKRTSVTLET